jgi:hypothetical protein
MTLKILEEFPDAVFFGEDVESLLGEAEVSSLQTRIPVRKGHNFRWDRWIAFKFNKRLRTFFFLRIDVESLLGEADVSSLQNSVPVRKRHNL